MLCFEGAALRLSIFIATTHPQAQLSPSHCWSKPNQALQLIRTNMATDNYGWVPIRKSLKCPPPPATKTRPGTLNSGSKPYPRIETGSHVLFMTLVSITIGAAQDRHNSPADPPHTKAYSIINPVPLLPQPNGSKQQGTSVLLFTQTRGTNDAAHETEPSTFTGSLADGAGCGAENFDTIGSCTGCIRRCLRGCPGSL